MNRAPQHLFRHRRSLRPWVVVGAMVAGLAAAGIMWLNLRPAGSKTAAQSSPSASVTPSASPTLAIKGKPKIKGVVVQVLNGTTRQGLAAKTSTELAKAGYTLTAAGNAPQPRSVTLITFQPGFGPDAAFIRRKYLPQAALEEAAVPFPSGVKITVILGTDAPG